MPFTRFAPIASRVSTSRLTTSISPSAEVRGKLFTSRPTAPPPRATMRGWKLLARSMTSCLCSRTLDFARCRSGASSTWIWPISTGAVEVAAKPPDDRACFAAALRAATIDGSSTASGTTYSRLLTRKFSARPIGMPSTPITFSIILSAALRSSVMSPVTSRSKSVSVNKPRSCTARTRSLTLIR